MICCSPWTIKCCKKLVSLVTRGHDPTSLPLVVECHGEQLELRVDLGPEVDNQAVSQPVDRVDVKGAQSREQGVRNDDRGDHLPEGIEISGNQHVVDHDLGQVRRDELEQGDRHRKPDVDRRRDGVLRQIAESPLEEATLVDAPRAYLLPRWERPAADAATGLGAAGVGLFGLFRPGRSAPSFAAICSQTRSMNASALSSREREKRSISMNGASPDSRLDAQGAVAVVRMERHLPDVAKRYR